MTAAIAISARRATVAVLALATVALVAMTGTAHGKSEYAVFSVSVEGQGAGAWLNPVGEGCVGPAQQSALRGSMRESLHLRTPSPTLVTVSGLNGRSGPMRLMPLDRRISAPVVQAEVTRSGPEDIAFRPSALIPGSTSLKTRVALPRQRLQRAKPGTVLVLRGPHQAGPDAVTGCKAPAPATCEPYAGELTVKLRFVCRARRTTESCAQKTRRGPR